MGFSLDTVRLLPLGDPAGIGPDSAVRLCGGRPSVRVSDALLGRVLDARGRPIDGGLPLERGQRWPIYRAAPAALSRRRVERALSTGIRAIDSLATLGEGQRLGLFSGSGVGKSTLLGQLARQIEADVIVCALIGERGREVREWIEDQLAEVATRSVIVVATSDTPALMRVRAAWVSTAIAEFFRSRGRRVLLLMDSITRFARAAREVGLAAGEPPTRRGFPPSVFAALPSLLERTGNDEHGSITAVYSVLVEGGDLDEPVADEVRGILDGHIVLDRELAARGRLPAIDPLLTLSRVMPRLVDELHLEEARRLREHIARYESKRDLILLGAYETGADAGLDQTLARMPEIERFLSQRSHETSAWETTRHRLAQLAR